MFFDWVNFNNKYNLIKSSSGYDLCRANERGVQPVHGSGARRAKKRLYVQQVVNKRKIVWFLFLNEISTQLPFK